MVRSSPITRDTIALRGAGTVQVAQPAKGHRFALDSILLADFCRIRVSDRVLEPGAGTGIISLLLARKHPDAEFVALEKQRSLHVLCEENVSANGLSNIIPVQGDIRQASRSIGPRAFNAIVANPPYAKTGTGRSSPVAGRRVSRQDILGTVGIWLDLQKYLKQGGRYCMVFAAVRLAELCAAMRERRLEPKRLRLVHPFTERPASLVLIEAVKDGGTGLSVLPPLVVHGPDGRYTEEMQDVYGGKRPQEA
jgi:tRNA1Val (adenine37-N6)-methyltransferase